MATQNIPPERLLVEFEDLLRTAPTRQAISSESPEVSGWIGRAAALIERWDVLKTIAFNAAISEIQTGFTQRVSGGYQKLMILIHQAQTDLRLNGPGPSTASVNAGEVFGYFDEIRKIISSATVDVFFVDPYLDPDFVSKYLVQIRSGVTIRLLGREKLPALLPAVQLFAKQHGNPIELRTTSGFHDRYVFVDRKECYQSGASFKDGARNAPTLVTQVVDAFQIVSDTYEDFWNSSTSQFRS